MRLIDESMDEWRFRKTMQSVEHPGVVDYTSERRMGWTLAIYAVAAMVCLAGAAWAESVLYTIPSEPHAVLVPQKGMLDWAHAELAIYVGDGWDSVLAWEGNGYSGTLDYDGTINVIELDDVNKASSAVTVDDMGIHFDDQHSLDRLTGIHIDDLRRDDDR